VPPPISIHIIVRINHIQGRNSALGPISVKVLDDTRAIFAIVERRTVVKYVGFGALSYGDAGRYNETCNEGEDGC
jgi:hypothetical protein